jgi:hypothetical protein
MISIQATVDLSQYAPRSAAILSLLDPEAKKEMHDFAATAVVELLRSHIRAYAATHHDTANQITGGPAQRTGHLDKAAEGVEKGGITADGAEVNIRSPGFRRALGPLPIRAKNKPNLTIPVHAISYGKTVADVVAEGFCVFRPKGKDFIATSKKTADGAALIVLFALKDEVVLKHAPEMLPERQQFAEAARDGVLGVVMMRLQKRGAA